MRTASLAMWLLSRSAIKGSAINSAMKIARILGTKTSDDHTDEQTYEHQRAGDQDQRHDRVARYIENFRPGHDISMMREC
jgi:hypothetical protein